MLLQRHPSLAEVRAARVLALALALATTCLGGCRSAPGGSCRDGEARCLDSGRALVCDDGHFVETPCRGKDGCSTTERGTRCDISKNRAGDACSREDEGAATCLDERRMLSCRGRRFREVPCRGAGGCVEENGRALCDQSVAAASERCREEGKKACSEDGHSVLVCHDRKMRLLYGCRGENGCRAEDGKLSCDQTVARVGDACDRALEGHVACSEDRRSLVVCQGLAFQPGERCGRRSECRATGRETSCVRKGG